MALGRHQRNSIASLTLPDGYVTSDHDIMVDAFLGAFKNRMGMAKGINMGMNLEYLLSHVDGLEVLSRPFVAEEIEGAVKEMPTYKAPDPDGFNGIFFKKCWHIISKDFITLANEFHAGRAKVENINDSIVLTPKNHTTECFGDYRPISLTSVGLKFWTKIAANRFQGEILRCIHKNQYGFIKTRTIKYCLDWNISISATNLKDQPFC